MMSFTFSMTFTENSTVDSAKFTRETDPTVETIYAHSLLAPKPQKSIGCFSLITKIILFIYCFLYW